MKKLLATIGLAAATIAGAQAADQYFAGDGSALTALKYAADPAGPFTSSFTAGNVVKFATVNGTGTGGSIAVGGFIATENFTLTSNNGTITNQGSGIVTIDVASGKTLDFSTQGFTTSATAGYVKSGSGVLALGGGTYGGGFTLSAGTVILRGVNGMGGSAAGTLTLNGGTVASSATRDLTGKYGGGITIGGNVQFGELATNVAIASSTANLTFSNNMALGLATRTLTIGNNGTTTLGGIISGAAGTGVTVAAASGATGSLVLSGANTYTGTTTVNSGTLLLSGGGTIGTGNLVLGGGTFSIAGITAGNYTLSSTQSLTGTGMIVGAAGKSLTIAGALAPGSSTGTITLDTVAVTLSGTSTFEFTAPGSYGLVQGTAGGGAESIAFGGTLNLNFSGGSYSNNSTFKIFNFNADSYSGNFSTVNFSGLGDGQSATFNPTDGTITVVPEPRAWVMIGIGVWFMLWNVRRRRRLQE
jgi:autotransporter-associated beta strand protein